ncbi:hypothetical protein EIP86_001478 [Pleurotus ostreatoroseus]|nr:hypothetical protein EIP86_001478 [Pleurotus ostreatoroseus]
MPPPTSIGILGGGLTGLSSAFHLSRRFPSTSITLLESSPRLGGWVHSERVDVRDTQGNEARVLLERGPRTLRPNGKAVLELTSPATQSRFLYIRGTHGLTALPSSPLSLFLTPLGRSISFAAAFEPFRLYPRISSADAGADEALEPFLARRLNPELARTLGSALVHGIYAGDSRVLSVRAAFPSLWAIAEEGGGSIGRGLVWHLLKHALGLGSKAPKKEYELGDVEKLLQGMSVYSFRDGMSTLVRALETELGRRANVKVIREDGAATLTRNADDFKVTTNKGATHPFTHLVTAMPLPALQSLLQRSSLPVLPHLTANPLSSVAVINLVFPPTPSGRPIHPAGFGYLVPRAPDEHDSLNLLGTVFDSCSLGAQDEYPSASAPRFTKMTMMVRLSETSSTGDITPERALTLLTQHLAPKMPLPKPVLFRVHALRGCIPVPAVGHVERTRQLKQAVLREWNGRLEVVGAGVGGVSVPDCIEQGRQVGASWQ